MINYSLYKNKNSKEWVTFVHGAGGSSSIWFRQIKEFKKQKINYAIRVTSTVEVECETLDNGLKKILATSEILIILLPLTKETFHIINYKTLSYMPKSAALINAGRGGLINDKALLESLNG